MALAPSRALLGVPSSSIMASSMATWSLGVHAVERLADLAVDVLDGLVHALAEVALLVAVAQLDGLVRAGGGAGGHGGAAERAVLEHDVDLDGRIAAAVEDLAGVDIW